MLSLRQKRENTKVFLSKDANLSKRVSKEFLDGDVATVPCKVSSYDDIISPYSVEGYETLNPEFVGYIESAVSFIPVEYPVSLEITGTHFTEKEQETIRNTIREDCMYSLGTVQKNNSNLTLTFLAMSVGTIITAVLMSAFSGIGGLTMEFLYILFWFFADTVVSYLFIDGHEKRKARAKAGRLASMSVNFYDKFDNSRLTKEEVEHVYEDMQK